MANTRANLIGQKFGKLIVISFFEIKNQQAFWKTICDCGKTKIAPTKYLRNGDAKSCGDCYGSKGQSETPEYNIWMGIKRRILSPSDPSFYRYGGRGLKICERWKKSFSNFLKDVGKRPHPNLTIDRKDNNLGYTCGYCNECKENNWPSNVRWADYCTQQNNKRSNHFITYKNKTLTLMQWSKEANISMTLLRRRLRANWSIKDAFEKPAHKSQKVIINKQEKSVAELSRQTGINQSTLYHRLIVFKWPLAKALQKKRFVRVSKKTCPSDS